VRAHRLAAAAQAAWWAAQPGRARSLAGAARNITTDPLVRADLDRLQARVEWNVGSPLLGHRILLRAAADVVGSDAARAQAMAMLASAVGNFAGEGVGDMTAAVDAVGLPDPTPDPRSRCYARLLTGFVHTYAERWSEAAAQFRAVFDECDPGDETDLVANVGIAAVVLGDAEVVLTHHTRLLADARESGALLSIVHALTRRAFGEIAVGDWRSTAAHAAEALDLANSSGHPALTTFPHAWLGLLAALRGDRDQLPEHLHALEEAPSAGVTAPIVDDLVRWTRGLAAETPAAALHHLQQVELGTIARLASIDRLEAAVRAERRDLAAAWVDELEQFGTAVGAAWALAAAAFGRALLATGDEAEAAFEVALEHAAPTGRRFDRARIQLAYGGHLRRSRRRVQARSQLRAALEVFEDLGAGRWTSQATQELRASGETARRRDVGSTVDLTAQERQVADLIRQGLSNRDAAARLFVSPRTIDFHLRNVFSKLDVASRAELIALVLD
jgi:DNA-binding CsgD family transcriptional regulator